MSNKKVIVCGLPRCGGQSIQVALEHLFPGQVIWHSPGRDWSRMDDAGAWLGAVEVFASPQWLEDNYPGSLFIYNTRDMDSWLGSVAAVYNLSKTFNHPMWSYPLNQIEDYAIDYYEHWSAFSAKYPQQCTCIDIFKNPGWGELCDALQVSSPTIAFPHRDRVRPPRPLTQSEVGIDEGLILGGGLL